MLESLICAVIPYHMIRELATHIEVGGWYVREEVASLLRDYI